MAKRKAPRLSPIELERLSAAELQQRIDYDTDATARLLNYLDARQIPHSGRISGATLAAVAHAADATDRTHSRTWRKWVSGERPFPVGVRRLLVAVCWGTG